MNSFGIRRLALFLFATLGGCGGSTPQPMVCPASCVTGSSCVNGVCTPDSPAADMAVVLDLAVTCNPACSGQTPYCNADHVCAACLTDDHCPAGTVCKTTGRTATCVPGCSDDSRCRGDGGVGGEGAGILPQMPGL